MNAETPMQVHKQIYIYTGTLTDVHTYTNKREYVDTHIHTHKHKHTYNRHAYTDAETHIQL